MAMDLRTGSRILERPLAKGGKVGEVNLGVFAFLFSEIVRHSQSQANGIEDFEDRLSSLGQSVGLRMHQLYCLREKVTRRENRLLNALYYVHSSFYKVAFGRAADSIESSNESPDEFMIIDQTPLTSKFISLPKELSQLNCNAFIAGMIQAVLAALDFPAKVSAHLQVTDGGAIYPSRTVFLIKFAPHVMVREKLLDSSKK